MKSVTWCVQPTRHEGLGRLVKTARSGYKLAQICSEKLESLTENKNQSRVNKCANKRHSSTAVDVGFSSKFLNNERRRWIQLRSVMAWNEVSMYGGTKKCSDHRWSDCHWFSTGNFYKPNASFWLAEFSAAGSYHRPYMYVLKVDNFSFCVAQCAI